MADEKQDKRQGECNESFERFQDLTKKLLFVRKEEIKNDEKQNETDKDTKR